MPSAPNSAKRVSIGVLSNISRQMVWKPYREINVIFAFLDLIMKAQCMACLLKIKKATYKLSWNGQKQIERQFSLHLKIVCILSAVRKVYKSLLFVDNLKI